MQNLKNIKKTDFQSNLLKIENLILQTEQLYQKAINILNKVHFKDILIYPGYLENNILEKLKENSAELNYLLQDKATANNIKQYIEILASGFLYIKSEGDLVIDAYILALQGCTKYSLGKSVRDYLKGYVKRDNKKIGAFFPCAVEWCKYCDEIDKNLYLVVNSYKKINKKLAEKITEIEPAYKQARILLSNARKSYGDKENIYDITKENDKSTQYFNRLIESILSYQDEADILFTRIKEKK